MYKNIDALAAQIEARCQSWNRPDAPGVILAIIQEGEVILHRGYGSANLEYDVLISPSTVFDAGSIAKQFTGMAVAMLLHQGKLSLDDDIRHYIPEVPDFGKPLLIRHLLHHTSGLRDWICTLGLAGWRLDDPMLTTDVLTMVKYQKELDSVPGDEFAYCNTGYTLLAEMIARIENEPFPVWMKARIFDPLGMTHTYVADSLDLLTPHRADSYYPAHNGQFVIAHDRMAVIGAGSLWTTSTDLIKWLLNYETQVIGGAEVIQLMHERGVLNDGNSLNYGLGLEFFDYRGLYNVGHGGQWAGFQASITLFPEQRFAALALCNLSSINPTELVLYAADVCLDAHMDVQELDREQDDPVPDAQALSTSNTESFAKYIGRYYSPELDVSYLLSLRDDQLVAEHRKHGIFPLKPVTTDEFDGQRWFFGRIHFICSEDGQVIGCRVSNMRVRNVRFDRCAR